MGASTLLTTFTFAAALSATAGCKRAGATTMTTSMISVVTMWPGAPAAEMERSVTSTVERALTQALAAAHVAHVAHVAPDTAFTVPAAALGVGAVEEERPIQLANGGAPVVQLEGPRDVDVRVRFAHPSGTRIGDVVRVHGRDRALVPLSAAARVRASIASTRLPAGMRVTVESGPLPPGSACAVVRSISAPVSSIPSRSER